MKALIQGDLKRYEYKVKETFEVIRGWPSASKIEAKILTEFELNLDHPGGNEEGNPDENHQEPESRPSGGEMLNLDHPGGDCLPHFPHFPP